MEETTKTEEDVQCTESCISTGKQREVRESR